MYNYYKSQNHLFSDGHLDAFIRVQNEKLSEYIKNLGSEILATNEELLFKELIERYSLRTPALNEAQIKIIPRESDVTIFNPNSRIFDEDETYTTKGLDITVEIPFNGAAELFLYQPSTYTLSGVPSAIVHNDKLVLSYQTAEKDAEKIKKLWGNDIAQIKQYLGWIDRDLGQYNSSLENTIKTLIAQRKQESTSNRALIDSLKQG